MGMGKRSMAGEGGERQCWILWGYRVRRGLDAHAADLHHGRTWFRKTVSELDMIFLTPFHAYKRYQWYIMLRATRATHSPIQLSMLSPNHPFSPSKTGPHQTDN